MSSADEYIYRIQPSRHDMLESGLTQEEERIVGEHFDYLKELWEKKSVVLAGRTLNTDASAFGIVILRVESENKAREIMQNDPAVKHGVMTAELFPYRIALMSD